jgi:hypothetical protein
MLSTNYYTLIALVNIVIEREDYQPRRREVDGRDEEGRIRPDVAKDLSSS